MSTANTNAEKIIRFNMRVLTSGDYPYQMEWQLFRRQEGVDIVTYPIMTDTIKGMIFYVGDRNLMPDVASAVMSQSNVSDRGTVTVAIDLATGRRTLSIQNAAIAEYGRDILSRTIEQYNARYSGTAEPVGYAACP